MAFLTEVTVRFREVDRVGIAFFARAFDYAHVAYEEILAAAFGDLEATISSGPFATPLVHTDADYKRPMRFGERLLVTTTVPERSGGSITFEHTITGVEDGKLRCRVRMVHAFVDRETFRPTACPEAYVEGLRRAGLDL